MLVFRMRMDVLAIVNQKGGAGETTFACALAGAGERAGLPSVLVDIDPRASAAHWAALREADTPIVTAAPAARLAPILSAVGSAEAALAVIDTAPHAAEAALDAVQAADLVLIPGRASPSPRHQGPPGGTRRPAGPEWSAGARPLPQPFLAEKRVGCPSLTRSGAAGDRPGLPLRRARTRVDQAERKHRTCRPILMGGYLERLAARTRLRRGLAGFLDRDRELFGLEPKETAAEAADA